MKTKKNFKGMLSLVSLTAIFSLSLASVAFAENAPTVTWKETIKTGNTYADQPVTETYDPASGTFKNAENEATTRTVTNTGDGNTHTYYFGVELPTEVKSGTVVVEAYINKPTNCTSDRQITLFGLSDKASGWATKVTSGLAFRDSNLLGTQKNSANESTWETRWNRDVAPATSGRFTRVGQNNNYHTLRFVASAANESADWDIKIYHKETNETIPVYTYTIPRSELPDIKCILNSSWYDASWTATVTLGVNQFQVTKSPQIVTATDGRVAYDKPLSVTFDSAIDESTIGGIQLKQGSTVVEADVALDDKTVTITPKSFLVDGQDYEIVIPATVAGENGLNVGETVINVTATDALYFTNLASTYNPTANIEYAPSISTMENASLKLKGYQLTKFLLPKAVESGVYYVDMKYKLYWLNGDKNTYIRLGIRHSSGSKILFKVPISNPANYMIPNEDILTYFANTQDKNLYETDNALDLRIILMSENDESAWKVLVYDKAAKTITHGTTLSRADFDKFTGVSFEINQATMYVDDVVIRKADDVNLINPAYDENAKKLTATVATAKNGVAIAAAYGVDGRLLQTVVTPLNPSSSTPDMIDVTFTTPEEIVSKKLMVWDGFENCNPLLLNPYE